MFQYFNPKTFEETFSLLDKYGSDSIILAGGTDILVNIKQKALEPKYIVNIKSLPNLTSIVNDGKEGLTIGALTTLHEIEKHSLIKNKFSAIAEAANQVGSLQIRNMGTIAGNICQERKCVYYNQSQINLFMRKSLTPCFAKGGSSCHAAGKDDLFHSLVGAKKCWASCCSDLLVALVCLNANIRIVSSEGERNITAEEFCLNHTAGQNTLKRNEFISFINIPNLPDNTRSGYIKYKRDSRGFAVASIAAKVCIDKNGICKDVKIVLGGVAPIPLIIKEAENELIGNKIELETIDKITQMTLKNVSSRGPSTEFKINKTKRLVKDSLNLLKN